jgi:GTP-binding protein
VDSTLYTTDVTDTDRRKHRQSDNDRIEASFVTSAPDPANAPPDDRPEIALAGRSNAGKSSVLNRLTGNRQTAKVSKTPGRTQLLNFFDVSRIGGEACQGRLVDLPGYGYAKARREDQARWQSAVNRFLSERSTLTAVVLVMDIRHPLQPFDTELIGWAAASHLPLLVLLNKADKLKHGAQQKTLAEVRRYAMDMPATEVLTFSALRGQNVRGLLDFLRKWLQGGDGGSERD